MFSWCSQLQTKGISCDASCRILIILIPLEGVLSWPIESSAVLFGKEEGRTRKGKEKNGRKGLCIRGESSPAFVWTSDVGQKGFGQAKKENAKGVS